ncbi:MAG: hypothetical protein ACT4TC_09470 [Myxococcaceae bacterium]
MRSLFVLIFLLSACDRGGTEDPCVDSGDCASGFACVVGAGARRICVRSEGMDPIVEEDDPDASTPYYCDEVQPILNRTCVSTCHGAVRDGSKDDTFRLDVFAQADGGSGAKAKAARIKLRMTDVRTMPPLLEMTQPTLEERTTVGRWARRGALLCADAGI